MLENQPVVISVKSAFLQKIGDAVPCAIVEQQTAEHRLLRFDRMRRHFERFDLDILRRRVHICSMFYFIYEHLSIGSIRKDKRGMDALFIARQTPLTRTPQPPPPHPYAIQSAPDNRRSA